jgi:hypothetical protein
MYYDHLWELFEEITGESVWIPISKLENL